MELDHHSFGPFAIRALCNPEFFIEHVIVEPPVWKEDPPFPAPPVVKSYVEDNVRRAEAAMPSAPPPPNARNNAGIPHEAYEHDLKRFRKFMDGDGFDPEDLPIGAPIVRKGW